MRASEWAAAQRRRRSLARLVARASHRSAARSVVEHFLHRRHADGGYCGFPQSLQHLASTYAAVNALVIVGTEQALRSIDREKMYAFLMSRKHASGGFTMHDDGELDVRCVHSCFRADAPLALAAS